MLKHLSSLNEDSNTSKLRISFKMVMFLCLYFISSVSIKKAKNHGNLITETMNPERGRKKNKNDTFEATKMLL